MKLSKITRWIGPAAIGYALFLVLSDMSGMPLPFLVEPTVVPAGSSVMGSGLILWAMVMLLVGMISLYARLFAHTTESAREKAAAEREALYREWELLDGQEEELFEREFGWTEADEERAEELREPEDVLRSWR